MIVKIESIEKVSQIDVIGDLVILGINTKAESGTFVSHGDQILLYNAGKLELRIDQEYFYLIAFCKGILYYEKEGDPIYYFREFRERKFFAEAGNYFNPLQQRTDTEQVLITKMDDSFNKTHYVYTKNLNKVLLPKFSSLLLGEYFICTSPKAIELFRLKDNELYWNYQPRLGFQFDKRNKAFSDLKYLFIPLKNGALAAIEIASGKEVWLWEGDSEYVSYGQQEDYIYVHTGNSVITLLKSSGKIENIVEYANNPELKHFKSNGLIWCFNKCIVVRNSGSGEIVIFDRQTFNVIAREIIDNSGIGESTDRIQLIGNYLYILATSSILHIYQLNAGVIFPPLSGQ